MDTEGVAEHARELAVDDERWLVLSWSNTDGLLLMRSHPTSEYHGGGPPKVEAVGDEAKLAEDLRRPTWTTRTPNEVVAFLVDRWCERRALGPLRRILDAWPNLGLTDGYASLREALDRVRSLERGVLTPIEEELAHIAETAIQRMLDRV